MTGHGPAITSFPAKVAERLGYYVYIYFDPRDGEPFYVGKGTGNRCFAHLKETALSAKIEVLAELNALGIVPRIEILRYDLSSREAELIESACIDLLGVETLTNAVRGRGGAGQSRVPVDHIVGELNAIPAKITHAMVLIVINRAYRPGMSPIELYDSTRSAWRANPQRRCPELAAAVFRGVIREVYTIAAWVPAHSTMRSMPQPVHPDESDRWEFVGKVADEAVRRRYLNRDVREYFLPGAQNPLKYVNC